MYRLYFPSDDPNDRWKQEYLEEYCGVSLFVFFWGGGCPGLSCSALKVSTTFNSSFQMIYIYMCVCVCVEKEMFSKRRHAHSTKISLAFVPTRIYEYVLYAYIAIILTYERQLYGACAGQRRGMTRQSSLLETFCPGFLFLDLFCLFWSRDFEASIKS